MAPIPIKPDDVDHRAVRKSMLNVIHLEDNTPVRTVKVTNFSENVTSDYLQGYFEHAIGPIENVSMVRESNIEKMAAYITFKVPEDAGNLICDTSSNSNIKFTIKQAEDIHQPKIDSNACKLVDINDDCLLHIISYLPLLDVVNLSETCVLLNAVTKLRFNKCKHFVYDAKTDKSINELTLPSILKGIGSYIRSLEIYDLNENILVALSEHCPEIHTLKIINPSRKLQCSSFNNRKLFFKNLECLEIQNSGLFDNSLKAICSSLKVTSLTLIQCRRIRGTFLAKLKKLKVLKVLDGDAFAMFLIQCKENQPIFNFQANNQLTVFGTDCCGCSYIHFLQRTESLQEIQELQLDFSKFGGDVSQLANLKCLTKLTKLTVTRKLQSNYVNFDNLLLILSESSKSLESFDVQRIEIGNSTLQHLGRIKNLKRLRLENIKNTIGNQLYNDFPTHQPNLRELTITVLPYDSPIASNSSQCISKMITSLQDLDYFSHSEITLELISLIQKNLQMASRLSAIKIGVPRFINGDLKKQFIAATKGMITPRITVIEQIQ